MLDPVIIFLCGVVVGCGLVVFTKKRHDARVIATASALFARSIPSNAVVVPGEKGVGGGGDGGPGIYWDTGLAILPGKVGGA